MIPTLTLHRPGFLPQPKSGQCRSTDATNKIIRPRVSFSPLQASTPTTRGGTCACLASNAFLSASLAAWSALALSAILFSDCARASSAAFFLAFLAAAAIRESKQQPVRGQHAHCDEEKKKKKSTQRQEQGMQACEIAPGIWRSRTSCTKRTPTQNTRTVMERAQCRVVRALVRVPPATTSVNMGLGASLKANIDQISMPSTQSKERLACPSRDQLHSMKRKRINPG